MASMMLLNECCKLRVDHSAGPCLPSPLPFSTPPALSNRPPFLHPRSLSDVTHSFLTPALRGRPTPLAPCTLTLTSPLSEPPYAVPTLAPCAGSPPLPPARWPAPCRRPTPRTPPPARRHTSCPAGTPPPARGSRSVTPALARRPLQLLLWVPHGLPWCRSGCWGVGAVRRAGAGGWCCRGVQRCQTWRRVCRRGLYGLGCRLRGDRGSGGAGKGGGWRWRKERGRRGVW